jgi:hypothetical protein
MGQCATVDWSATVAAATIAHIGLGVSNLYIRRD